MKCLYEDMAIEAIDNCIKNGEGINLEFYHNDFTIEIYPRYIPKPDFDKPGGKPLLKDFSDNAMWRKAKNIYDENMQVWSTNRVQNIEERKTVRRLIKIKKMIVKLPGSGRVQPKEVTQWTK